MVLTYKAQKIKFHCTNVHSTIDTPPPGKDASIQEAEESTTLRIGTYNTCPVCMYYTWPWPYIINSFLILFKAQINTTYSSEAPPTLLYM